MFDHKSVVCVALLLVACEEPAEAPPEASPQVADAATPDAPTPDAATRAPDVAWPRDASTDAPGIVPLDAALPDAAASDVALPDAAVPDVAPSDVAPSDVAPSDVAAPDAASDPPDPPPISGGTLAITRDGTTAVVADPDNDRVLLVDLASRAVTATFALTHGDEPGRIAEDGHHRAHVVLRGAGALLTIDLNAHAAGARRVVCPIPRGVAWDAATDNLYVACLGGELVTLPAAGGASTRTVRPDSDLRDVVVMGNRLLVTRFRAAETLVVDERGDVTQRLTLPSSSTVASNEPAVAWRTAPAPGGGLWMLHQRVGTAPVSIVASGSYSGSTTSFCDGTQGIVRPALALVRPPSPPVVLPDLPFAPLAVDLAVAPGGDHVAVAVPGNVGSSGRAQVIEAATMSSSCLTVSRTVPVLAGQAVAVAYTPTGTLVALTRAPATLVIAAATSPQVVALGGEARMHVGHRLFHSNPTGVLACASCHAEGDDDGRVWRFDPIGPRRTHHIRGGILGSEPFHWDGDERDFDALVAEVMVRRMRAPTPTSAEARSLAGWVDRLPERPRPTVDAAVAARGEALFRGEATGCAGCHAGTRYTNNMTVDVGTGGAYQVPSLLGLAWRAPYMHDGRARTLEARFDPSGGGDMHGHTSQLSAAQIADLVAFLETL